MPEPVELRVRGGERRGMAVAEPDDRDPGDEVEVALALVVVEPGALAARRTSRPRVRRSAAAAAERGGLESRAPPSRRSRRGRRARGADRGSSLGTIPPSSSPRRGGFRPRRRRSTSTTRPSSRRPGTSVTKRIRSAPSPTASAAAASSALTLSGPGRERRDDRDRPAGASARGPRRGDWAAGRRRARARDRLRAQADLVAQRGRPPRADRRRAPR